MLKMTRKELAQCAGVDVRTLRRWMQPHLNELYAMGMPPGKGAMPPNVVQWIAEKLCIDIDY